MTMLKTLNEISHMCSRNVPEKIRGQRFCKGKLQHGGNFKESLA